MPGGLTGRTTGVKAFVVFEAIRRAAPHDPSGNQSSGEDRCERT